MTRYKNSMKDILLTIREKETPALFKPIINEQDEPASPDEGSMAMDQLKFIAYAANEIMQHVKNGGEFPEWMQNKLSGTHEKMKSLHANIDHEYVQDQKEEVELEEKLKVSDGLGAWITDFKKSDAPQFKGKSDEEKKNMAIAAFVDAGGKLDEAVLSGRDYKVKDGKVHISKANFKKVKKDYKNDARGKERMVVLDPKTQATVSMPVVFTEELDEAYKTPSEAKAYEDGKKAARSGKKYEDNPMKKGSKEYTAWSKGHNDARMKEETEINELRLSVTPDEWKTRAKHLQKDKQLKDYDNAAKHIAKYAVKSGGIDKRDMMKVAAYLKRHDLESARKHANKLDTDPRDWLNNILSKLGKADSKDVKEGSPASRLGRMMKDKDNVKNIRIPSPAERRAQMQKQQQKNKKESTISKLKGQLTKENKDA